MKKPKEITNAIHLGNDKTCKGTVEIRGSYYTTEINCVDNKVDTLTLLLGNSTKDIKQVFDALKKNMASTNDENIKSITSEFISLIRVAINDQLKKNA